MYYYLVAVCSVTAMEVMLGVSRQTLVDWLNFVHEVAIVERQESLEMIGGPGKTVEVDESLFGRRKYH